MKPPVKNFKLALYPNGDVTQWFSENPDLYARMGMKGHNGIDIVRPHGEQMFAVEDAEVVDVKDDPNGYGRHVRIIGTKKNRANSYNEWTYGHCHTISVKVGDQVEAGDPIATMGNTGFVVSGNANYLTSDGKSALMWKHNPYAGTHLHIGLRQVLKDRKGWSYEGSKLKIKVLNHDNGYKGSIDPFPFLAGLSVPEEHKRAQLLTIRSLANTLIRLLSTRKGK